MEDVLHGLVGSQIQIYSMRGETEITDTGTLEAYDSHWLLLRRNGMALYFSISQIRLIEPL